MILVQKRETIMAEDAEDVDEEADVTKAMDEAVVKERRPATTNAKLEHWYDAKQELNEQNHLELQQARSDGISDNTKMVRRSKRVGWRYYRGYCSHDSAQGWND
jgi:hypothetical protein